MTRIIKYKITEADLDKVLCKSVDTWVNKIVGVDNLRDRPELVRLDNIIRGYLGEHYFENEILNKFNEVNVSKDANNKLDKFGMDIDFKLEHNGELLNLEIKTSGLSTYRNNVDSFCAKGGGRVVLIDRDNKDIDKLKGDIHAQIIFNMIITERDKDIENSEQIMIRNCKNNLIAKGKENLNPNAIIKEFFRRNINNPEKLKESFNNIGYDLGPLKEFNFVGWGTKEEIKEVIGNKPDEQKMWHHVKRDLWDYRIHESNLPTDFNENEIKKRFNNISSYQFQNSKPKI